MSTRKRICVIGLGAFGRHLASTLARDSDVLAIDQNQSVINDIADHVQRAICVDARDFSSLSTVVSKEFDEAITCMSESIETSILCVLHLKKIGIPVIHAKSSNRDHAEILSALGVDNIIFPERESAERLANRIQNPNILDFIPVSDEFMVLEMAAPQLFCGKTLKALDLRARFGIFVLAVREYVPERFNFLPGPDFVIKDSDSLMVIGRHEHLDSLRKGLADPATLTKYAQMIADSEKVTATAAQTSENTPASPEQAHAMPEIPHGAEEPVAPGKPVTPDATAHSNKSASKSTSKSTTAATASNAFAPGEVPSSAPKNKSGHVSESDNANDG